MNQVSKIRILIVDDHAIVRMGLAAILGTKADLEVVGDAEDGTAAIQKAQKLRPDVVLMDIVMPEMDGATATAKILQLLPQTKVIILTSFGEADGIAHALDAGASGALMKNVDYSELVTA
ncbi:MAG: response regulator transcription factor, partial [Kiritimatiellae bacterium]|nr:response regulator transcription factor [Kiritimatiellia bacterium]